MNRREFLHGGIGRALELASTIPLMYVAGKNFFEARQYYGIDISGAIPIEQKQNPRFCEMGNEFRNSLDDLYDAYKEEYLKTHTRLVSHTDGNGHIFFSTETYTVWEEPSNVPDHTVVYNWKDKQNDLLKKTSYLTSEQLIDGTKLERIVIDKRDASRAGQGAISMLLYGGEVALLLGYEELTGLKESSSKGQTNRRSLFKIGAAGVGAYIASKIYGYNKGKNELSKGEFDKKIKELHVNISKDGSFSRYFNDSPSMVIDEVNRVLIASKETLNNGIKSPKVQSMFQRAFESSENHLSELRSYFANGVPDDLADFARDGYITQQLKSLSSSAKNRAYTGIVLEGLAVAGAMAALLVPAELISKKIEGLDVKV